MKKIIAKGMALILVVTLVLGSITVGKKTEVQAAEKYTIKVNLGTNCTTIYKGKKAVKAMICSPSSETPTGTFYIPVKYRWHEMIGNCYAQYCTRITTGILFHSVWYYKNGDKSTMSVAAYNVMGNKASHGCVRLLCKDAKWIYDKCPIGTKIVIFWGDKSDDPLPRPSFTPIKNGKFTDWDPTDPDPNNPYRKRKPTVTVNQSTVEYGKKVNPLNLVTIQDSAGNTISDSQVKVKGKINTKKLGTYNVRFSVKDSLGNKTVKTVKFKVVDTKAPKITGAKSKKDVAQGSRVNLLKGVKARSATGIKLTSKIKVSVKYKKKKVKVKKGFVLFSKKGTYKITYTVKGKNKKKASKTVTYKVKSHKVKLTLTKKNVTVTQGDKFNYHAYVKSVKSYKGKALKVRNTVTYTGNVDTSKPGTYIVTYKAQYKNQKYTAVTAKLKVVVTKKATVAPETPTIQPPVTEQPTEPPVTEPPTTEQPTTEPEEPTIGGNTGESANETTGWTDFHETK